MSPRARSRRPARHVDGALSEAAWQSQVIGLGSFYGWMAYHAPAGGKDGRVDGEQVGDGFPDLVLVRGPELLFVELKPDKVKPRALAKRLTFNERPDWTRYADVTDGQAGWLEALAGVGAAAAAARRALELVAGDEPPVVGAHVEAHLWRPADFDELVHPRLARGRQAVPADFAR